jgi:hypothetical protein
MKGYFSRLMVQTGITAGPAIDSSPKTLVQARSREDDIVAPIDIERAETVESQGDDAATPESPEPVSAPSIIPSVEDPAEQNPGGEVPRVIRHPPGREGPRGRSEPPEEREAIVRNPNATPPRPSIAAGESLEAEVTIETDTGEDPPSVSVQQETPGADKDIESPIPREDVRPAAGDRTRGQTLTRQPDRRPRDRTETWEGAVREIREWVAGTPVVNDAEVENTVRSENQTTGPDLRPIERERFAASYPDRATPSLPEGLETRGLHLAIGTISVTVEEPRREIEVRSSDDRAQKPPSAGNDALSRLGRHYIRTP